MNTELSIAVNGQGLYEITSDVAAVVKSSGLNDGLATVYIRHTSASLVIQENADPAVQRDLEAFLARVVPEGDSADNPVPYTHVEEGADDMPAHIKSALTQTHLSIPVVDGRLALGTWQGVFLWEHRHRANQRRVIVNLLS
ncbi:MAG: secondary thiamine-phosphate synthase enzyme YjbQ [Gammaproteobacteria bacterium]|nr:secondary thiamine-phosphate synthase enzyme YjbQ [Gammaproteobacteria bacterium]